MIGFAAPQHHLINGLGRNNRKIWQMFATVFLVSLTALVISNVATRITVRAGDFDELPRPTQID